MSPRHTLLVLLALLTALPLHAQQPADESALPQPHAGRAPLRFDRINLDDGLSQGSVYTILQDRQGFMWFGTQDGLNRYDGHTFEVYKSIPFDSTSLQSSHITTLHETGDGTLWVGLAGGGIDRFERASGTFTHFPSIPDDTTTLTAGNVNTITEAEDGTLWVGTDFGLSQLDPETGRARRYRHVPGDTTSLSNNTIYQLHEDEQGYIWANTGNGLNRLDPGSGTVRRYLTMEDGPSNGQAQNPAHILSFAFLPDPDEPSTAWITTGQGFLRFDTKTGTYERFLADPQQPEANVFIDAIADPHEDGIFWLAGFGAGLYRFDSRTQAFEHYRHAANDPSSLSSDMLFTLYADRSGTMWAGSITADGVNRFVPTGGGFTLYSHDPNDPNSLQTTDHVFGLYVAPSDPETVWIGATRGTLDQAGVLYRLNRRTGTTTPYRHDPADPASIAQGTPRAMLEDHTGTFWVGTGQGGLCRMDRRRETFDCVRAAPDDTTALASNIISTLLEDGDGTLWVGTLGGLHRYDRATQTFERLRHDPEDPTTLSNNFVRALAHTPDGALWVGTNEGLDRLDPATGTFEHFPHDPDDPSTLGHSAVNSILVRPQEPHVLWIGTAGGGFDRLDTRTGTFTHFTEWNSGLPNSYVYGILSDAEGHLWMSTNNGLARFDPVTHTFRVFDSDAGLQSREFNQFAYAQSPTGELLFGGPNGVSAFLPDQLSPDPTPPQVALTAFRLFNHRVEVRPDGPLTRPLAETRSIRLAHWQKTLGFDFVGLHYKDPAKNRYAYRLDGFDDTWIEAGTQRTATYTNLDPGTYTFRVRAANSDGVWNHTGAAVQLTILPPWWQTWWFRVLALGSLLGLAYGGYRARIAQIRTQNRRLEAEVEARTKELRQKNDLLEKSHAIVQALNAETQFEALLHTVLEQTRVISGVEKASALVYDDAAEAYVCRASLGWDDGVVAGIELTPEEAEARYVRQSAEVAPDVFVEKNVGERPASAQLARLGTPASLLVMRVSTAERTEGYLVFDNMHDRDAFDDRDVALLEHLRAHVASAFVKTRLLGQLRRSLDELRQTQAQLVQQEKMASLGQLTAGIAHEIKNPLNFVNNFAQLTAELVDELDEEIGQLDGSVPKTAREEIGFILEDLRLNAQKIEEHGRRADGIVRSMLQHSRGSAGERQPTDLNALVDEYVSLAYHGMRAAHPDFNVTLDCTFDDTLGEVEVMPQEIGRVLINLLNNAFYAVHQRALHEPGFHPEVHATTCRRGEAVEVIVSDNGTGIPEDMREKVFEPFFTTKPTGEGTGLGLSMSYDIITQGHGGAMTLETAEGQGTTFHITLPIEPAPSLKPARPPSTSS